MRKNGAAAAQWMKNQYAGSMTTLVDESRKGQADYIVGIQGHCQRACRQAWGFTTGGGSAWDEWLNILAAEKQSKKKYTHNDPRLAPVGAVHFWKGGENGYGHVAIQAERRDYAWSTDFPATNRIGLVKGSYIRQDPLLSYVGWSHYFCGRDLSSAFPKDEAGIFIPAPLAP